jgi:hypothetical protein
VHVFGWNGREWVEEAELTASDAGLGDTFGRTLALRDGLLAVGAWGRAQQQGAVCTFRQAGGQRREKLKLTASDGATGDRFGASVPGARPRSWP